MEDKNTYSVFGSEEFISKDGLDNNTNVELTQEYQELYATVNPIHTQSRDINDYGDLLRETPVELTPFAQAVNDDVAGLIKGLPELGLQLGKGVLTIGYDAANALSKFNNTMLKSEDITRELSNPDITPQRKQMLDKEAKDLAEQFKNDWILGYDKTGKVKSDAGLTLLNIIPTMVYHTVNDYGGWQLMEGNVKDAYEHAKNTAVTHPVYTAMDASMFMKPLAIAGSLAGASMKANKLALATVRAYKGNLMKALKHDKLGRLKAAVKATDGLMDGLRKVNGRILSQTYKWDDMTTRIFTQNGGYVDSVYKQTKLARTLDDYGVIGRISNLAAGIPDKATFWSATRSMNERFGQLQDKYLRFRNSMMNINKGIQSDFTAMSRVIFNDLDDIETMNKISNKMSRAINGITDVGPGEADVMKLVYATDSEGKLIPIVNGNPNALRKMYDDTNITVGDKMNEIQVAIDNAQNVGEREVLRQEMANVVKEYGVDGAYINKEKALETYNSLTDGERFFVDTFTGRIDREKIRKYLSGEDVDITKLNDLELQHSTIFGKDHLDIYTNSNLKATGMDLFNRNNIADLGDIDKYYRNRIKYLQGLKDRMKVTHKELGLLPEAGLLEENILAIQKAEELHGKLIAVPALMYVEREIDDLLKVNEQLTDIVKGRDYKSGVKLKNQLELDLEKIQNELDIYKIPNTDGAPVWKQQGWIRHVEMPTDKSLLYTGMTDANTTVSQQLVNNFEEVVKKNTDIMSVKKQAKRKFDRYNKLSRLKAFKKKFHSLNKNDLTLDKISTEIRAAAGMILDPENYSTILKSIDDMYSELKATGKKGRKPGEVGDFGRKTIAKIEEYIRQDYDKVKWSRQSYTMAEVADMMDMKKAMDGMEGATARKLALENSVDLKEQTIINRRRVNKTGVSGGNPLKQKKNHRMTGVGSTLPQTFDEFMDSVTDGITKQVDKVSREKLYESYKGKGMVKEVDEIVKNKNVIYSKTGEEFVRDKSGNYQLRNEYIVRRKKEVLAALEDVEGKYGKGEEVRALRKELKTLNDDNTYTLRDVNGQGNTFNLIRKDLNEIIELDVYNKYEGTYGYNVVSSMFGLHNSALLGHVRSWARNAQNEFGVLAQQAVVDTLGKVIDANITGTGQVIENLWSWAEHAADSAFGDNRVKVFTQTKKGIAGSSSELLFHRGTRGKFTKDLKRIANSGKFGEVAGRRVSPLEAKIMGVWVEMANKAEEANWAAFSIYDRLLEDTTYNKIITDNLDKFTKYHAPTKIAKGTINQKRTWILDETAKAFYRENPKLMNFITTKLKKQRMFRFDYSDVPKFIDELRRADAGSKTKTAYTAFKEGTSLVFSQYSAHLWNSYWNRLKIILSGKDLYGNYFTKGERIAHLASGGLFSFVGYQAAKKGMITTDLNTISIGTGMYRAEETYDNAVAWNEKRDQSWINAQTNLFNNPTNPDTAKTYIERAQAPDKSPALEGLGTLAKFLFTQHSELNLTMMQEFADKVSRTPISYLFGEVGPRMFIPFPGIRNVTEGIPEAYNMERTNLGKIMRGDKAKIKYENWWNIVDPNYVNDDRKDEMSRLIKYMRSRI